MRIRGWFSSDGEPFIGAEVFLPSLGIRSQIKFVLDSGSDETSLGRNDLGRLGIDLEGLERVRWGAVGVGGLVDIYRLPDVHLIFRTEGGKPHSVHLDNISGREVESRNEEEREILSALPSVLGRDVIDRFCMIMCRQRGLVILTDEALFIFALKSLWRWIVSLFVMG
jgi:hypothetical protein